MPYNTYTVRTWSDFDHLSFTPQPVSETYNTIINLSLSRYLQIPKSLKGNQMIEKSYLIHIIRLTRAPTGRGRI